MLALAPARGDDQPALKRGGQHSTITIETVRIGFDGKYKSGHWAPVWLSLGPGKESIRGRLDLVGTDGDDVPVVYPTEGDAVETLGSSNSETFERYLKVGPQRGRIGAQLRDQQTDDVVWSSSLRDQIPLPLAATQELIVTIGPDIGLAEALKLGRRPEGQSAVAARVDDVAYLPSRWWGYAGVDWVFLTTRGPLADELSTEQFEALRQWVLMGGRLVLSVGVRGEEIFADDNRLASFAPGKFSGVRPLRDRAGLEAFSSVALPWEDEAFQRSRPVVSTFERVDGRVEIDEGGAAQGQPLAVRRTYGFGFVVLVTIDLDDPHLAEWKGRPRLIHNLLQRWQGRADESIRPSRQSVQHLGFTDLSGQLRAALEQFQGVTVVNVATVAVLTLAYLLLIGPADFLLVRWAGLPAYTTWVSFPLVVVAFCGAAWYMADSAHGGAVRLNEAEVIDIDTTEGLVRGTTWHHLYSPVARQFNLRMEIGGESLRETDSANGWLAWQGLPGSGLGGLASEQVSLAPSPTYSITAPGEQQAIDGLPVQVSSSKALSGRWWGTTQLPSVARLKTNQFGLPEGEVRNPFDFPLDECLLAYDEWLFRLKTIGPGDSVRVEDFASLNLEARLTQRTVVDAKDITTPWDQASVEVPRIMQMMLFHETARGRGYTGLSHAYLGYLDMTEQIRSGRAILVGRSPSPLARLVDEQGKAIAADDATESYTWVRFVLPVDRSGSRRN